MKGPVAEFRAQIRAELIATGQASKLLLDYLDETIELAIQDRVGQMIGNDLERFEEELMSKLDKRHRR